MTKSIERREGANGVWETVVVDENGGSGNLPDPSGEPDGDVLTVSSGAAVWAPGGGSQPVSVHGPFTLTPADGLVNDGDTAAVAYSPAVGDILLAIAISYDDCVAWDDLTDQSALEFGQAVAPLAGTGYHTYVTPNFFANDNLGPAAEPHLALPYVFTTADPFKVGLNNLDGTPGGPGGALVFSLVVASP